MAGSRALVLLDQMMLCCVRVITREQARPLWAVMRRRGDGKPRRRSRALRLSREDEPLLEGDERYAEGHVVRGRGRHDDDEAGRIRNMRVHVRTTALWNAVYVLGTLSVLAMLLAGGAYVYARLRPTGGGGGAVLDSSRINNGSTGVIVVDDAGNEVLVDIHGVLGGNSETVGLSVASCNATAIQFTQPFANTTLTCPLGGGIGGEDPTNELISTIVIDAVDEEIIITEGAGPNIVVGDLSTFASFLRINSVASNETGITLIEGLISWFLPIIQVLQDNDGTAGLAGNLTCNEAERRLEWRTPLSAGGLFTCDLDFENATNERIDSAAFNETTGLVTISESNGDNIITFSLASLLAGENATNELISSITFAPSTGLLTVNEGDPLNVATVDLSFLLTNQLISGAALNATTGLVTIDEGSPLSQTLLDLSFLLTNQLISGATLNTTTGLVTIDEGSPLGQTVLDLSFLLTDELITSITVNETTGIVTVNEGNPNNVVTFDLSGVIPALVTTLYTGDGTLTGPRTVSLGPHSLTFVNSGGSTMTISGSTATLSGTVETELGTASGTVKNRGKVALPEYAGGAFFEPGAGTGNLTMGLGVKDDGCLFKFDLVALFQDMVGLRQAGTWNASSGEPPSDNPANHTYWVVTEGGSTDLNGTADWEVGDWAVWSTDSW